MLQPKPRLEAPKPSSAWSSAELLLRSMRPQQWVKNAVVFSAPLFALRLDGRSLGLATLAFIVFAAGSSAAYLINDVADIHADQRHPRKRHRPIAAGLVSPALALGAAGALFALALGIAFIVGVGLGLCLSIYLLLQAAYTLVLKRQPIIDLMTIASGFVLRALGGAAACGVAASGWFLLCLGFLALFLAIEKRKAEIRAMDGRTPIRAVLRIYSNASLQRMESVATASAVMSYGLWAIERSRSLWMLATLPVVAYGIFRYQLITERGEGEEPERVLFDHPELIVALVIWLVLCGLTLVLGGGLR